ncbi:MAG: AraC family transcriptional regulator [Eubacteriales bacterium]|nr:AraC family transcriptional regulator [Eubacteriales bacterium]
MFYETRHLGSPDYLRKETGVDFSFPAHLHGCFEIVAVRSGQMTVTVDGKAGTLRAGDALMIFPNQIHSLSSEKSEHVLCIFSPDLVSAYATKVSGKVPESAVFRPEPSLLTAMSALVPSSPVEVKKGVLYLLCAAFDAQAVYAERAAVNEKPLFGMFSFVEREYAENCTLRSAAAATGYDYSYLSRLFKRIVGIPFNTYVAIFRLSRACYLLENTDYPVLQCALESGYASVRSFNRHFQAHYGMTPVQYRRSFSA